MITPFLPRRPSAPCSVFPFPSSKVESRISPSSGPARSEAIEPAPRPRFSRDHDDLASVLPVADDFSTRNVVKARLPTRGYDPEPLPGVDSAVAQETAATDDRAIKRAMRRRRLLLLPQASGEVVVIALNLGAEPFRLPRRQPASTAESCSRPCSTGKGKTLQGALILRGNEGVIIGASRGA